MSYGTTNLLLYLWALQIFIRTVHSPTTQKYKRKLVAILSRFSDEGKISKSKYKQLYPTAENVPRLYCTPKIHKPNAPLRPIVDYTSTIGYESSKWLADILAPMVGNSSHHVLNSKALAEELVEVVIEEGDILNSHDVVSLFTCTPISRVLDIVKERLQRESWLKEYNKSSGFNLATEDVVELLEFILSTTYFTFRGKIYRQRFGAAMGSPVSPLAANIFMEHLESTAIATAPLECKPKLWKRYVDDILEIVAKDEVNNLTDHLNQTDDTDSIKFTFEKKEDGKIPFLDTLIVRREDGSVKLLVYRKATHTDQYLNFKSQHPLHQKLGVMRTLLDRKNKLVTEDQDKVEEEKHIKDALQKCGYPAWSVEKVKNQMAKPKPVKKRTKKSDATKSKGLVVIPYVEGVSERISRVFKSYNIATAMKPHCTLRNLLVHPKDKREPHNSTDVIYSIPCGNCDLSYIGETGRKFGKRLDEHKTEAEKIGDNIKTRATRKASQSVVHKSAITDHVVENNHVIDWKEARIVGKESNR
ncbi:uncharacterized protein [Amphiura filiformis]|uniref:uncharacterized protein n=1 Tax=Amphiura filiformis TaxID=82378 RepID=UPI003B2230FE